MSLTFGELEVGDVFRISYGKYDEFCMKTRERDNSLGLFDEPINCTVLQSPFDKEPESERCPWSMVQTGDTSHLTDDVQVDAAVMSIWGEY